MGFAYRRWHRTALAAACMAAAGTVWPSAANDLAPMDGMPTLDQAGSGQGATPRPQGNLVWGGPVPPMPAPGQDTVYVPSTAFGERPAQPDRPDRELAPMPPPVEAGALPPLEPVDDTEDYAALEDEPPAYPPTLPPARGVPAEQTPMGYAVLPEGEALCRRELARLGAQFTEAGPVGPGNACGIPHALKVQVAVRGIAMQPPATLNCRAALQVARWLDDDVRSAARWRLWKNPTAVINASSYRCSRIAGSRTVSEHATGNALDVGGFRFSDGSTVRVEPKGIFRFRERAFQNSVRQASCRHFGTVLGPGYNRAHDDHFHLDAKQRRRAVCK
ncbi:extensin family protein [Aureimonas altamirensis]|uniref:extensin-like domain-containing protein n=1 Tax=Aureimonas altamirensis TaxID=370622 RepID=UPI001FD9EBF6|nr:extensin family protein [Aureimonas altamirensis]